MFAIYFAMIRADSDFLPSVDTPLGFVPKRGSLNTKGLNMTDADLDELFSIDPADWKAEVTRNRQFFANFKDRLPARLNQELNNLEKSLDTLKGVTVLDRK